MLHNLPAVRCLIKTPQTGFDSPGESSVLFWQGISNHSDTGLCIVFLPQVVCRCYGRQELEDAESSGSAVRKRLFITSSFGRRFDLPLSRAGDSSEQPPRCCS